MNKWISIKNQLPEDKQIVITKDINGNFDICLFVSEEFYQGKLLNEAFFMVNPIRGKSCCYERPEVEYWIELNILK